MGNSRISMMQIIECEQGSPEWYAARLGLPTASEFATVMAKGEGKTRRTYMLKLAGEIVSGQPMETYNNVHMERGKIMEDDAREFYAYTRKVEPQRVGFIRTDAAGVSPDSLIGDDGGLEIKTALPHLLIEYLLKNDFPPGHKAQVQGALWITGRAWWDLLIYYPGIPKFVVRATPDKDYIANMAGEVDRFNDELAGIVAKVRAYK